MITMTAVAVLLLQDPTKNALQSAQRLLDPGKTATSKPQIPVPPPTPSPPAKEKPEWLGDPGLEVATAMSWLAKTGVASDSQESSQWRFLSAYNMAPRERAAIQKTLVFLVNALNFQNPRAPLVQVGPSLWAINLQDPGWTPEVWEKTFAAQTYFQTNWLPQKEWADLLNVTHSQCPIVRADQFIVMASLDEGYYDLLGLPKTQKELLEKLNVSIEANAKIYSDLAGNVTRDLTVSQNNRRLVRYRGVRTTWISYDVKNGKGKKNVMKQLGKPIDSSEERKLHDLDIDGNEIIFELANGLHGYFLNDAAGNRLNFVDTQIAKDENYRDKSVHSGRSCITCHTVGINPFRDHFSEMLETGGVGLKGFDKRAQLQINMFYDQSRLQPLIQTDSMQFALAVKTVNGLSPEENAKLFTDFHRGYVENRVGIREAAIDMGLPEIKTLGLIREAIAVKSFLPSNDPNLASLAIGKTIARDSWEDSFFAAMVLREDVKLKAPVVPKKEPVKQVSKPKENPPEQPKITYKANTNIVLPVDMTPGAGVYGDLDMEGPDGFKVVGHKMSPDADGTWELTPGEKPKSVHWVYRRNLGNAWKQPKWLELELEPKGNLRVPVETR